MATSTKVNSTEQVLRTVYAAFNSRDVDTVLGFMHPDVDWPNGMEGGRVHGHNGVREYWTRQWKTLDPKVEPVGFAPDHAGRTVVEVKQVVHDMQGTLLMDRMVQHIYTMEDGLIRSMEIRESEQ
jgi:hypothetical protein